MIDPTAPEPPVELSEVLADDELVSRLSRRAGRADEEPLAALLASWAAEVDAATDVDLAGPAPLLTPVTALTAVASRRRSRPLARGSRLAVVVTAVGVGLGSLTGVAAAVTGDPLAPYRPVISGVLGGAGSGGPSSAEPGSTDPGATTDGPSKPDAKTQGHQPARPSAKDDHPATGPGVPAARDGWLAHWPGLPPQAVGPGQRPGIDGRAPGGGPAFGQEGDRPGSSRADEVRPDRDKDNNARGRDEGAGRVVPHGATGDGDAGSGPGTSTPPGHPALRR